MNSLDRADLLNRCHAARSYLGQIKQDFDRTHALGLATAAAAAAEYVGVCIKEINRQEDAANAALGNREAV